MRRLLLLTLSVLLTACGGGYAPVYEQSYGGARNLARIGADEYRVRPGDTLIAIAFRLGVDSRELQRINGIRNPDRIYVGQVLKTRGSAPAPSARTAAATRESARRSSASSPVTKTKSQIKELPPPSDITWNWPHDGRILARFSGAENGNKGLDISGNIGDSVKAAAAGEVVYAGSGLLGYGNLVIISHNRDFLSAYAHNSRILVKENQKIKAGEPVAELGNTGASVPMLHFEIRRDGRPVDPLKYLPKR